MLVLSRAIQERTTIYDREGKPLGEVIVQHATRGQVRLGFEFPENVKILRSEKVEREKEREAA